MNEVSLYIGSFLGLGVDPKDLTFVQISLRGLIVFAAALTMLRLGDRRFLSRRSAFDVALGFILASMLARAVNGSSAFFPTIGGGFVIIGLHRFLAFVTQKHHSIGLLIKGKADLLIQDGEINQHVMHTHNLSEHDLKEDLRVNGNCDDSTTVKRAYYERNGQVSIIKG